MNQLASIFERIATRITRDGVGLAMRYYFSAMKHGLLYLAYDRRWDRLDARRTSGATDLQADDLVGPVPEAEYRRYHSFPRLPLLLAINTLPFDPPKYTFIDYGSGRGRLLLTAARLPFLRVFGVEFSRTLHEEALQNIGSYPRDQLRCGAIASVHMNAVDFEPPSDFVAFFFNPFPLEIIERVADRIEAAARRSTRPCFVIFANTKRFALFVGRPAFRRISLPLTKQVVLDAVSTVPIEIFALESSSEAASTKQ